MIQLLFVVEDLVISAKRVTSYDSDNPTETPHWARWEGICVDQHSGKEQTFQFSDEQMAAVQWLMICGDNGDDAITTKMYEIAEEAVKDWPKECRPFP